MNALRVRPAVEADAADLAVLVTQLGYASTAEQVRARFARLQANPDICALVAEHDGRIIGMVGLMVSSAFHRDELHGYVTAMVVDEKLRRSGAGAALMAAAEDWFRERGLLRVNLTTALHREGAHHFYEKLGYALTGKRYTKTL